VGKNPLPQPAPPEQPPADPADELTRRDGGRTVTGPDKDFLKQLGMTKRMAMKILASGKSEKYLNTKVTARVLLVTQANSVDQIMMAQRKANLMAKDKSLDPRTRCACLAVVPQCGMALARLSEVAISTARNLDLPEDAGEKTAIKPVQNNYFGFPPVVAMPLRNLTPSAKTGETITVEAVES
jgi:hypothetical protein